MRAPVTARKPSHHLSLWCAILRIHGCCRLVRGIGGKLVGRSRAPDLADDFFSVSSSMSLAVFVRYFFSRPACFCLISVLVDLYKRMVRPPESSQFCSSLSFTTIINHEVLRKLSLRFHFVLNSTNIIRFCALQKQVNFVILAILSNL